MNKITTNTACTCCEQDTLLRIVAGNDFSLRLTLTYKDEGTTKQYDLSDAEDLIVNVVTPDGDRIELDSIIDANSRITTIVDAQQLNSYINYGIEVIWHSETGDKRAAAPNLFTFVNSSQEANDAQDVIIEGPYDYNLEIRSDIAYVTLGEIPDIDLSLYVTQSQLNNTLSSYVTSEDLSKQSYVTKDYLSEQAYITIEDVSKQSYVTKDYLSEQAYITIEDVSKQSYVTKDYLSEQAYITIEDVPAPDLSLYYTKSEIDNTLESYVTDTDFSTSIAPINSDILSLTTRVTTLENNPQVPDNVVTSDDANEIVCLTQEEYNALEEAQTLDPNVFYYITDATSNYVTNSSLNSSLSNYATKNYVNTAVSQVKPDTTNLVTINTTQTISGTKMFTAESKFGMASINNNSTWMNFDLAQGIYKSSLFVRPTALQMITGEILAPNSSAASSSTSDGNLFNTEANVIKFRKIDSNSGGGLINSISELARIDSNGIYEGDTLLSDKYAKITNVPTATSQLTNDSGFITINDVSQVTGVTGADWDNTNEAIAKELVNNRTEHLSINDKFNDYYTKTETDTNFVTKTDANNSFVTKTDADANFVTKTDANNNFVTKTDADANYVKKTDADANFVTKADSENSLEAITKELVNNRAEHLSINDKFNDYYTKTNVDTNFVTKTDANNSFVTKTDADANFVTNTDANNNFVTKTDANNNFVTKTDAENNLVTKTDSENSLEAITATFVHLKTTIDSEYVSSSSVKNIWKGSQSDYDQLIPDENTLYIII